MRLGIATLFSLLLTTQTAGAQPLTVFEGVNVIPMDADRILSGQSVEVRGDRIVAIGPAGTFQVEESALRIPARGLYLIPGLGEMHGHIPSDDQPPDVVESILFLYLSNGVTTVRGMLGGPGQLEMREEASRGEILAPTLYLAGPSFSGRSIDSPAAAIARVRAQKAEGWDFLKVHPGLTLDEYDAMASTAREVNIPWVGHVPADVGIDHALEAGQETIDHLDGYMEKLQGGRGPIDSSLLAAAARETRARGAWVVPTMALWETVLGGADLDKMMAYPELRYMPREMVDGWVQAYRRRHPSPADKERIAHILENRKGLLKAMSENGTEIIFGTDAPQMFSVPGFSIHRETRLMIESGLTPYAILSSATAAVGEYLKDKDDFGTVAVGKRADLVLLKANPLDDIRHLAQIEGVMVRGRWLSKEAIASRLDEIARKFAPRE